MRIRHATIIAAGILACGSLASAQTAKGILDGKKIFLDNKCNTCHAVSSAKIQATTKVKAPDLAGVAAKEDAAFLAKFLRKKENKNGKPHMKAFTGSDEEIGALIAWLQKQTPAEKK